MKLGLMISFLVLAISSQCLALGEDWVSRKVTAIGDAWLRTSPPKGLFCTKGEKIDLIKKTERVKVLGHVKITCAVVYSYDFIKVERLAAGIPDNKRIGYVIVTDDTTSKPVFVVNGQ